jgi:hypothetical protein
MKQQACIALLVYINASTFVYLYFVLANACMVVNTPIIKKRKKKCRRAQLKYLCRKRLVYQQLLFLLPFPQNG